MRPSNYNIYVELNNNQEYYFITHGYTGALDLLSAESAKFLMGGKLNMIDEETAKSLKSRGYITDKTKEEEIQYVKSIAEKIHSYKGKKKTHSFMFIVTSNCNFRCTYCFENLYSNKGDNWTKHTFTKEMVDRAYDAMLEIEPIRSKHSDDICLYGGEPLLKDNYDIVNYIIDEGKKREYNFQAITNGYDLDSYLNLLGKDKINNLQITIDGIEEIHNSRRIHYKNNDSFSKIIKNIELALPTGVKISIRINIDKSNFEVISKLTEFFREKGFYNQNNFRTYAATTYRNCSSLDNSGESFSKGEFTEKLVSLRENNEFISSKIADINDLDNFLGNAIKKDNYLNLRHSYCGAHKGMRLLDPLGKIYSCWETLGFEEHEIGSYKNGITYNENRKKWDDRIVTSIENCKKCKYALICGGGCAGKLASSNNDIYKSNCDDFPNVYNKMVNFYYNKELLNKV